MAVFLDVLQAFDKVWHEGLLYKIKNSFPTDLYAVIKSYLLRKTFKVKYAKVVTQLKEINSGVSQGSVIEPVLYLLYIADLPIALSSTAAIYADDSAILVAHNKNIKVSAITRKSLLHLKVAKKMGNQS
jgi:hypothetical protein